MPKTKKSTSKKNYDSSNIKVLKGLDAVRKRPGMYIGDTDDGSGLHHMVFEVLDNSIDEYVMGAGKTIEVSVQSSRVVVRDYGRGIPLGKLVDVVSKMNTGGKYDSRAFKKSVGLNGVGTKAVNALSSYFNIKSIRDGKSKSVEFTRGSLDLDEKIISNSKIKEAPEKTVIPSHRVSNIIELPWGAYPSYVSGYYSRDDDHYIEYDTTSRDEDKLSNYLKNWVHDAGNIQEYKKLIGNTKIKELEEGLCGLKNED